MNTLIALQPLNIICKLITNIYYIFYFFLMKKQTGVCNYNFLLS